jgi:hypothetical protein
MVGSKTGCQGEGTRDVRKCPEELSPDVSLVKQELVRGSKGLRE